MKGTDNTQSPPCTHGAEDAVESLLRQAALRERPEPGVEQAIRSRLHNEWRELTTQRKRRGGMFAAALAATVLLALVAVLRRAPEPVPAIAAPVATVERVMGQIEVITIDGVQPQLLQAGDILRPGQSITGRGGSGLSLSWLDGTSIRVDQDSSLQLTASGEISLEAGRVYVDTQASRANATAPLLLTPAGRVRHLGTRYMIAVDSGSTRVSVREGRVELQREHTAIEVDRGEQLSVDAGGHGSVDSIPVFGAEWAWAQRLAAPFELDGRTLAEFLEWVSGETGMAVEYDDAAAEQTARSTELRGSIHLPPQQALDLVLQTSDLIADVNYGIIRISPR